MAIILTEDIYVYLMVICYRFIHFLENVALWTFYYMRSKWDISNKQYFEYTSQIFVLY